MLKLILLALLLVVLGAGVVLVAEAPAPGDRREALRKAFQAGNSKDAYEGFRALALDPKDDPAQVGDDLKMAIQCLHNLGRVDEVDAFREAVVAAHPDHWRLLLAAAQTVADGEHFGFIVAGEFSRGHKRGGGKYVSSLERDRVRALQWLTRALGKVPDGEDRAAVATFHLEFARVLKMPADHGAAWKLQALTDLAALPDYEEGYRPYGGGTAGAPVDADGKPVLYRVPKDYESSRSDGERWRWMLARTIEADPGRTAEVQTIFAGFLHAQFGVQTMASAGWSIRPEDDDPEKDTGTYALHTLGEDETIARLATGIKRFKLPDEFNFIRIFGQIAEGPKSSYGEQALGALAGIFSDRRQYPKAAEAWKQSIAQYGPGPDRSKEEQLDQIVGNWGRFEPAGTQPSGRGATVDYRFRNGRKVRFEAHAIKIETLLDDVQAYLKSNPGQLDWNQLNVADIGYRLVAQEQQQYLGERAAAWDLDLDPRPDHFDRRITVTTPLQRPGAYLLTARMADGNTTRIVLWVSDTTLVKKPLENRSYYFVADSVTGAPVPEADVSFFGYRQEQIGRTNRFRVLTAQFSSRTDADGQVMPDAKDLPPEFQWLVVARTGAGRLAYLGFSHAWYGYRPNSVYDQAKVFLITDRPVYRPDQAVKFKFWVRRASYERRDAAEFANRPFKVQINNPQGETVFEKEFTSDASGGFDGEFPLPKDATLGQYALFVSGLGGGGFRVEEYKKPEFEVTVDAPSAPVQLGEKITATVLAKYYFGAPVTNATVRYKVQRSEHTARWYPPGRWDWLYGPGYGWFGNDYTWYPGWNRWGIGRPSPWWWPVHQGPPELVLEHEVPIGPDGTVKVEIDTALAKELHGDADHRYEITAEVVDASRRTIVGTGRVLVARRPFQVFVWVDRGFYRAGDVVGAHVSAQTLDQKPVRGHGALALRKITYDAQNEPVEAVVQTWDLDTDDRGAGQVQIKAAEPGQYRLSYTLTDAQGHAIEGGHVFVVRGEDFASEAFRFNDLELVTDRSEYAPGDTVRLMINTDRAGGTVVLFVRPENGVYPRPKVIRLEGKSTVEEVRVATKDMPNFFVEAFTVAGGRLFSEVRQVAVPPEQRVYNVAVEPSQERYKPGGPAKVRVRLTDLAGEPLAGTVALSVYDKSVEYISGGSNVPEIRKYYWEWRRSHYPQSETNLGWTSDQLLYLGQAGMQDLGVFGQMIVEEVTRTRAAPRVRSFNGAMAAPATPAPAAAPMAEAAMPAGAAMRGMVAAGGEMDQGRGFGGGGGEPPPIEPTVRTEFADTALWAPALVTDDQGRAEVELKMPENLTGWMIKAWAMGADTRVGQGQAEVVTAKDLLIRLQAPRFFVQTDEVVLSANVHNYLKTDQRLEAVLELDGPTLVPLVPASQRITVKAGGEQRVDWRVRVVAEGEAVVRMKALGAEESDAMEQRFRVSVHGLPKLETFAGAIRPEGRSARVTFTVPEQRRAGDSRIEVRYSPTLAGAIVDALPYLADYPYGCTEQTLNRFLPTVIAQNILLRMGLDLEAIRTKRANLNAQELGDARERAAQWRRYDRNPVFDEAVVRDMVQQGLKDLAAMQLADGGWGWFSGYGEQSYPHTTALVVHGLQVARQNDVALAPGVLERGVEWLGRYQAEQVRLIRNAASRTKPSKDHADNIDAFVHMVLTDADEAGAEMRELLDRDRTRLSVYALTMYGLALQKQAQHDKLAAVLHNIEQYLVQDDENQTAYLRLPESNSWWYWYGSEVEAQAYYLKLLARNDPQGETAARLAKYLLNNRKHATYWNSTRDTAIAVEALADFLTASHEDRPDLTVEVLVDGRKQKEVRITAADLFRFDDRFVLAGDAVEGGEHTIELRKTGSGPLYFNAYVSYFSLEDFITRAGLELKVDRKYYKLVERDKAVAVAGSRGQALTQRVEAYDRHELDGASTLASGDLVEIELQIDSKNDYEYLVFEDRKAAGFEPVEVRSGYTGNGLGAYMELRDEKVCFFVRSLARGQHSVSYRMRAEIPGSFSALPTVGYAMYAPELRGNSDEIKVKIGE